MDFGQLLKQELARKAMSALAYAQRLGYRRNGFVSNVISGKRTPPLDKLDTWMDALDLPAAERAEWWLQANLAHAPEAVREDHRRLLARIATLEGQLRKRTQRRRRSAERPN